MKTPWVNMDFREGFRVCQERGHRFDPKMRMCGKDAMEERYQYMIYANLHHHGYYRM